MNWLVKSPFSHGETMFNQWPFQEPIYWRYLPYIYIKINNKKMIFKKKIKKILFFRPKFQGISPQNMAKPMVRLRTSIDPEDLRFT